MKASRDFGGILVVIAALAAVGAGLYATRNSNVLWSLILFSLLVKAYPWYPDSAAPRHIGGMLASVGSVGLVGWSLYLTNNENSLWAFFLIIGILAGFNWKKRAGHATRHLSESFTIAAAIGVMIYALILTKNANCLWALVPIAMMAGSVPLAHRASRQEHDEESHEEQGHPTPVS